MKLYDRDYELARKLEIEFAEKWNNKFKKKIKHIATKDTSDFQTESNKLIELKCDSHTSENFAIEIIANNNKGTLGGPYQAHRYGADYYVLWFYNIADQPFFVFETDELLNWLKDNKDKYFKFTKVNHHATGSYGTVSLIVPRADLLHLCQVRDFKKEKD